MISYIRIFLILAGIVLCVQNHYVIALIVVLAYGVIYFSYLHKNHDLLLKIHRKESISKITGYRYSFRNPLEIWVK